MLSLTLKTETQSQVLSLEPQDGVRKENNKKLLTFMLLSAPTSSLCCPLSSLLPCLHVTFHAVILEKQESTTILRATMPLIPVNLHIPPFPTYARHGPKGPPPLMLINGQR